MKYLVILIALAACGPRREAPSPAPAVPPGDSVAAPSAHRGDAHAAQLLRDAGVHGAVLVQDVETGEVVASAGVGRDVAAPVLPLSVIKLYVAALWWEHELGDGGFDDPRRGRVTVHRMLVDGYDRPGELLAIELRRRLGGDAMLAELRALGLGPTVTLAAGADDATWGAALSLGERDFQVTLDSVSAFLRGLAARRVRPDTARRVAAAMRDTVEHGTARTAAARVPNGWHLGGKTGTGPIEGLPPPYDGWFAGLIFEGDKARFTVAVYIDRAGAGGGVAAALAAALARFLAG